MTPAPERRSARSTWLSRGSRALLHRCASNARRTFAKNPHEVSLYGLGVLLLIVLVGFGVKSPIGTIAVFGMLWALSHDAGRPRARSSRFEAPEVEPRSRAIAGPHNDRDHQEAPWKLER